jgi:hypothetical protein
LPKNGLWACINPEARALNSAHIFTYFTTAIFIIDYNLLEPRAEYVVQYKFTNKQKK